MGWLPGPKARPGSSLILTAEGCDIFCDGNVNELPEIGANVIVAGVVETDKDGTNNEIDVEYWAEYGDDPQPPSEGTIYTVEEVLLASEGSIASLQGKGTAYGNGETGEELIYDNGVQTGFQAFVPERVFAVKMSPSGPCEVLFMQF